MENLLAGTFAPTPDPSSTSHECPMCQGREQWTEVVNGYPYEMVCQCYVDKMHEIHLAFLSNERVENSKQRQKIECSTFQNFKPWDARVARAKGIAEAYVLDFPHIEKKFPNSLAILGEVGSGKTTLAMCVLNALMMQNIGVVLANYRDIVDKLKASVLDASEYGRIMREYANARVLIIDDLYKQHTAAELKYVYELINKRYEAGKPVVITSEFEANHLVDIDQAVGSRLLEMCAGETKYIFEMRGGGLNYRLRGL